MLETLGIIALFMARIGIPLVVLVVLGMVIGRWQDRRNAEIKAMYAKPPLYIYEAEAADERVEQRRKAA